ncbi:hypothetical protein HCN44_000814 [Aphidius gifuensis]|uniref:BEN domain-containing protein n=1 Tax=Aphidius gifuensis TaxID=684658 RepID=A0A835CPT7_APHGI|nr:hypothetical protein HCN44_000814 [Aphidius gifuensis]
MVHVKNAGIIANEKPISSEDSSFGSVSDSFNSPKISPNQTGRLNSITDDDELQQDNQAQRSTSTIGYDELQDSFFLSGNETNPTIENNQLIQQPQDLQKLLLNFYKNTEIHQTNITEQINQQSSNSWQFRFNRGEANALELIEGSGVFISKSVIDLCKKTCTSQVSLARALLDGVFTHEALSTCSRTGRGLKKALDKNAMATILLDSDRSSPEKRLDNQPSILEQANYAKIPDTKIGMTRIQ